jgi:hypothetical protein
MIRKKVIRPGRVRRIDGGFGFIPHRFLTGGFLHALNPKELLLYFFLTLASDRYGLSFYAYDAICSLLGLSVDGYVAARDGLIEKDLIAFDGRLFQVLDLPESPVGSQAIKPAPEASGPGDRSRIRALIQQSLWGEAQGGG